MGQDRKPGYWAVLPSDVRYDPDLRPNAKLLYAEISALANATGYCWATNERFAELFNLSIGTVSRLVSQLEDKGYIRCEMAATEKGSERRIYSGIFSVRVRAGGLDENSKGGLDENDNTPLDENGKRGLDENVKQNNKNKNNINNPHTPKGGRRERKRKEPREAPDWKPDIFARLWKFYPKEGRKDKQCAMDAWDKLSPDDKLVHTIAWSVDALKKTKDWQRGVGIPYLSTFLNNSRWKDAEELDTADPAPSSNGGWAEDAEVL